MSDLINLINRVIIIFILAPRVVVFFVWTPRVVFFSLGDAKCAFFRLNVMSCPFLRTGYRYERVVFISNFFFLRTQDSHFSNDILRSEEDISVKDDVPTKCTRLQNAKQFESVPLSNPGTPIKDINSYTVKKPSKQSTVKKVGKRKNVAAGLDKITENKINLKSQTNVFKKRKLDSADADVSIFEKSINEEQENLESDPNNFFENLNSSNRINELSTLNAKLNLSIKHYKNREAKLEG